MAHKLDTELDLQPRTVSRYIISSQHRKNGNPNKCIWTISRKDEVECFVNSKISNWVCGSICWGLKLSGKVMQVVGINNDKEELRIAKFIDGTGSDVWHGYPADYLNRKQDIPSTFVLQIWVSSGYIGKSDLRKIRQGMPCNL